MTRHRLLPLVALACLPLAGTVLAQERITRGWTVRMASPETAGTGSDASAATAVESGISVIKGGGPVHRPGRAGLLLECRKGTLAMLAVDLDWPPGSSPVGAVDVKVRIDQGDPAVERWSILGNAYEPPDAKGMVERFVAARSFSLQVPSPLGDRELSFDLDGFSEVAGELRKSCPF
jgi:hypothetical protein